MKSTWQIGLRKLLNVKYPIIQGAMLGVTTPQMVAAVTNSGGLGTLPIGGLAVETSRELIKKVKSLTDKPFAVNLFVHEIPKDYNVDDIEKMQEFIVNLSKKNDINIEKQAVDSLKLYTYHDQVNMLLEEGIKIVSFTFGILNDESIRKLKKNNVVLIGTSTCVEEATQLEAKGIDIITAQGIEAGGHRGTFLSANKPPQVGTLALVTQVLEHVNVPVLAAGGIMDGKAVAAALMLGASGAQMGSAFLCCDESGATSGYQKAVLMSKDTDTVLTRCFSGRWARGINNKFIEEVEASGLFVPEYPFQNSFTAQMRSIASKQDNKDFLSLWAGQAASKAQSKSASEIVETTVKQVQEVFDKI